LWICIGFNADPDPAFYLSADPVPDLDPESQTWSGFEVTKSFYMKNIQKVGKRSKSIPAKE
jgi:hypothetical protein